jgi:hypothetical protein
MTRDAAIAAACTALALVALLYALRCLAERLLTSAAIYTVVAIALFGGGLRAALAAL